MKLKSYCFKQGCGSGRGRGSCGSPNFFSEARKYLLGGSGSRRGSPKFSKLLFGKSEFNTLNSSFQKH